MISAKWQVLANTLKTVTQAGYLPHMPWGWSESWRQGCTIRAVSMWEVAPRGLGEALDICEVCQRIFAVDTLVATCCSITRRNLIVKHKKNHVTEQKYIRCYLFILPHLPHYCIHSPVISIVECFSVTGKKQPENFPKTQTIWCSKLVLKGYQNGWRECRGIHNAAEAETQQVYTRLSAGQIALKKSHLEQDTEE